MHLSAKWEVLGVVTENRELTSEKNPSWRGYVCKVATFGITAELQLTQEQHKQIAEGEYMQFAGRLDEQGGRVRFVCESFKPGNTKTAAS